MNARQEAVLERPWSRADRRALALLVLAVVLALPFSTHPWYDRTNDGSVYLACARALARGQGYSYLGECFRLRPPGLSLLCVPFVGGAQIDFFGVNLVVGAFGALAAVLLFVYSRARLGASLAFVTSLFVWLTPGFRRLSNQVMSDVPGLALLLGVLLLERWARRRPRLAREVLLGLSIGLSAWVRSASILLVPAVWVARLLGRGRPRPGWRELLPFAATALAVLAPWLARNAACAPEGPVDQSYQESLGTLLWRQNPRDPSSPRAFPGRLCEVVPLRASELLRAAGTVALARGNPSPGPGLLALGALWLGLAAVALARRREVGELYLAATFGLLLLLPSALQRRYALPLLALAVPLAAEALRWLIESLPAWIGARRPRHAGALAAGFFALATVATARPHQHWDELAREHADLQELGTRLRARLGPEAVVAAPVGWHLTLLLDRPVYSLRFAYLDHGATAALDLVQREHGVNTVVLIEGEWPAFDLQEVLLERGLRPRAFRVRGLLVQVFSLPP